LESSDASPHPKSGIGLRLWPRGEQYKTMLHRATKKNMLCRFAQIFAVASAGFFSATAAPIYFTRTWQVEQGLPQNKVTAVVQTRDGYLWIGTYNGLARFDGVRFTVFYDNNTPATARFGLARKAATFHNTRTAISPPCRCVRIGAREKFTKSRRTKRGMSG
jgi:hypothetical protein